MIFSPGLPLFNTRHSLLITIFISCFLSKEKVLAGCYTSIIAFGDSLTDTGNRVFFDNNTLYQHLPYGESFIYGPTGRCSNGRLIIDLLAEAMGLPFIPPYLGHSTEDFKHGVNFAVVGSTVLDTKFYQERGVDVYTNYTLKAQLGWFKHLLPSLCNSTSNCKNLFQNTLFFVGPLGGNDYGHALDDRTSLEDIISFVPPVIAKISEAITVLINEGAVSLLVPGNFPIGCLPSFLTTYQTQDMDEYDACGCLKWINGLSLFHNRLLQDELTRLREMYPHVTIMYADYYNAAIDLFCIPEQLGLTGGAHVACCGGGGPYNYNPCVLCGDPRCTVCDDVSLYVCWDGTHLTEEGYKWVASGLLKGSFTVPPLDISCTSSL